ncbi:hypothetical protein [Rhizobium ruizarguesonis]|uniref:hypothetical protein n=1 Tax=Rhizobium ruizarguesonis TaxID=2081791 RepID=UPI0013DF429F|nr:hypothetical protein [Rhizobium ruizarguesonis]NEJ96069.1 hypothetical protein [Rhizobium ruizarguesonis]
MPITAAEGSLATASCAKGSRRSTAEEAAKQTAEDMQAIGEDDATPVLQYFASVVHQRMYCLICGADPDTLEGGNPDIAYHVIRNSPNIAKHYWSADIEPYPSR